jgi:hypothetical protein
MKIVIGTVVFAAFVLLVSKHCGAQNEFLGTVVNNGSTTCPTGSSGTCIGLTVTPVGDPAVSVKVAINTPSGTTYGTVLLHNGSEGTTVMDNCFVTTGDGCTGAKATTLLNLDGSGDGFQTIQIAWIGTNGWNPAGEGFHVAGGYPATLSKYIFQNINTLGGASAVGNGDRTHPFDWIGISGGCAAVLYPTTQWEMAGTFDYVACVAGPAPAAMEVGCSNTSPNVNLCPLDTSAFVTYSTTFGSPVTVVNDWENISDCGTSGFPANQAEWNQLAQDDPIPPSNCGGNCTALTNYPQTNFQFYTCCASASVNVSAGMGFYVDQGEITGSQGPSIVTCTTDCTGESAFADPVVFTAIEAAILDTPAQHLFHPLAAARVR